MCCVLPIVACRAPTLRSAQSLRFAVCFEWPCCSHAQHHGRESSSLGAINHVWKGHCASTPTLDEFNFGGESAWARNRYPPVLWRRCHPQPAVNLAFVAVPDWLGTFLLTLHVPQQDCSADDALYSVDEPEETNQASETMPRSLMDSPR